MFELLTPLFMLGLAGLTLPIIFHLIRRTPRGRQTFSSLMFLSASPPRLTRRSRLDNLLLLLLRALALILLVMAFSRPFWRKADDLMFSGVRGRRVAIVLDRSASMRQGNLWTQATAKVESVLKNLEPTDDVALFVFDRRVETIINFDEKYNAARASKPKLVSKKLAELGPTWSHTDLASALITVADSLEVSNDLQQSDAAQQIVLITDMQEGAKVEALQGFEWPADVQVAVEQVSLNKPANASIHVLDNDDQEDHEPLVRISNAPNSNNEQFHLRWTNKDVGRIANPSYEPVSVYVPPGQHRVIGIPRPTSQIAADRLVLEGDTSYFDNSLFVVPLRQREVKVVFVGNDTPDDSEGLCYFLDIAFSETPLRKVTIAAVGDNDSLEILKDDLPQLIVVSEIVTKERATKLEKYVESGGTLFVVPKNQNAAVSLASFVSEAEPASTAVSRADYIMFGDIDFTHPLFASFASPQYSDFTKIHFWQSRQIDVKADAKARVVARFDNGRPALWEQSQGSGKVFVLASGWHPADSQLARSTKFVPLLGGILEQAGGGEPTAPSYVVGDSVPLFADEVDQNDVSDADNARRQVVNRPDGSEWKLPTGATQFDAATEPGIYHTNIAGAEHRFAVNVASIESQTAPMDIDRLEELGVRLGTHTTQAEEIDRLRQLRDTELEGKQKIWRWLLVIAMCVLILETWLAGRTLNRPRENQS